MKHICPMKHIRFNPLPTQHPMPLDRQQPQPPRKGDSMKPHGPWWALIGALVGTLGGMAHADVAVHAPAFALYTQECGSCHMTYPTGLLPAASWQQIMRGLKTHYGLDASLDETSQLTLTTWLTAHAGTGKYAREAPKDQRITLSSWFVRKHRAGEVPTAVWRRKSVGSPANCVACHADAERGDFNEDKVRIPP
jgi:hypothetical protein